MSKQRNSASGGVPFDFPLNPSYKTGTLENIHTTSILTIVQVRDPCVRLSSRNEPKGRRIELAAHTSTLASSSCLPSCAKGTRGSRFAKLAS